MYSTYLYILPEWTSAYKKTVGRIYYKEISENLPPRVILKFSIMGKNKQKLGKAWFKTRTGSR